MKKKVIFLLLILVFCAILAVGAVVYRELSEQYQPNHDLAENSTEGESEKTYPAVDFTVTNLDGQRMKLSDSYGKPIVINFWATWCGPCRSELPAFEKAYQLYGDEISFWMVNLTDGVQETEAGVREFLEENGYTFPVYLDLEHDAAYAYGVSSVPLTVLITAEGTILRGFVGAMSEDMLFQYIEMLKKS